MNERRQLPRWQIKREAKVWLPQMQEFSHCIIENINFKGMCGSFNKRLPQEQSVNISLDLEDNSDVIKLEVDLLWAREDHGRYVYGMSFKNIRESDKDRIYQYTISHFPEQFKDKWWAV